MKDYKNYTCNQLRCEMNRILNYLREDPGMSQKEKDRLNYELAQVSEVLKNRLIAMFEE